LIDRRTLIAGLSAALIAPRAASAETVTDAAGRTVPVPAKVSRVFPAGPPAALMRKAAPAIARPLTPH